MNVYAVGVVDMDGFDIDAVYSTVDAAKSHAVGVAEWKLEEWTSQGRVCREWDGCEFLRLRVKHWRIAQYRVEGVEP